MTRTPAGVALSEQLRQRSVASLARVVHIRRFLKQSDLALVGRLERAHHELLGQPAPARPGWTTTYLNAGGLFRAAAPKLHSRLASLRHEVDLKPFELANPGEAHELLHGLEARCIELHEGRAGGSLNDPRHFDNGSVVTVDVMLNDGFSGGALTTLEADGSTQVHAFAAGDALVFPSYKYHSVGRITGGVRRTLVIEYWRGDESRCNHRSEVLRWAGGAPCLCDDARTTGYADADGVTAVFDAPGPLGLGFGFADAADPATRERRLVEDGRPVAVTITEVRPGTQAAGRPQLEPGLRLTHVAGAPIGGLGFAAVDAALGRAVGGAARPLELRFLRPPLDLTRVRVVGGEGGGTEGESGEAEREESSAARASECESPSSPSPPSRERAASESRGAGG